MACAWRNLGSSLRIHSLLKQYALSACHDRHMKPAVCQLTTSGSSLNKMQKASNFNPLNPIVHFWLHHTVHCAEKMVSARLCVGSVSAERMGQGEVGGVFRRVLCTWQLLGLAVKRPWLAPGMQVNMRQESKGQGRSDVDGNCVGCGLHMRTSSLAGVHLVAFSRAVPSAND